ncbi:hypothetical protein EIP91_009274 [Steccherinum ochraceum]|uniref:Cyclin N-terminal domain-containing protein n=1 Tax=Steccherinum ochraceum TaxID=92696 RepID=A0A4R0R1U2_9APHY|nr:hypothetical protein EIP91_009274 [Steccherinum ochraceum]
MMELLEANPKYTATLIEYIAERVIETVRLGLDLDPATSRGRSQSRSSAESIARFIHRVLYMSESPVSVLLVTLVYLDRAKDYLRISQEQWAHERVFLGALICAHKYVNDVTLKNRHWSICSGIFSARDVSRIEREFLQVLDYELGFTESHILLHRTPIMALSAPHHHRSSAVQSPLLDTSSSWDSDSDEEMDSDSGSSCGSSSPPSTPQDVDVDASSSFVNIASHPHSPPPSVCSQTQHKTRHHPLSAALRLLHAFPQINIHHVPSHRAEPVKSVALPPAICLSSSPSSTSPQSPSLSPALKSHHDILVTARYERAFC